MFKLNSDFKSYIVNLINNINNFKIKRKIIVIESDDWGSTRLRSKKHYQNMLAQGLQVKQLNYDRLDTLESKSDLSALFDILAAVHDSKGKPAAFTFNTILGSPDYDKIKEDDFHSYHFEYFEDTYKRYFGESMLPIWKEGIDAGIIYPQFHATEHLNVSLWMEALKGGLKETLIGFDNEYFALPTATPSPYQRHYLASYYASSIEDLESKSERLRFGLQLFKDTFGFASKTFIACNYIWPKELEPVLLEHGVKLFQGQRVQLAPNLKSGSLHKIRHFTGECNDLGQRYGVRNCVFEPSADTSKDWVDSCLSEISSAFFWKTPAIISSHRVNYVGGIEESNRDKGLQELNRLLKAIVKRWPDVEFLSSNQLLEIFDKPCAE